MRFRTLVFWLLWTGIVSASAEAAVVISPAAPRDSEPITIELVNAFGMEASVASAEIRRSGNAFTIIQVIDIGCFLPSNPTVLSRFEVGTLPPGVYTVTASMTFVGTMAGCDRPPLVQSGSFTVGSSAVPVPTLDAGAMILLAASLAAVAAMAIDRI